MARAYLGVDGELKSCFVGSQEDKSVRWVCGKIEGESVILNGSGKVGGTAAEDFDGLKDAAKLTSDEPAFVMFARDDESETRRWMLVAWVPDTAAPRLKMIYSSSREDLKTQLGAGYFGGFKDYCANAESDLAWEMVLHFEQTDHDNRPLTEQEQLFIEEKKLEKDTSVKSSGMANLPFRLTPDAQAALGTNEFHLLEIKLETDDTLGLGAEPQPSLNGGLQAGLSTLTEPRFLLARQPPKIAFIYFCPDDASLKQKMTYSTAKSTFAEILRANDIIPAKSIEVRDPADLDSEFASAVTNDDADKRDIVHADLSKPARPGRKPSSGSKARLKKWNPDG